MTQGASNIRDTYCAPGVPCLPRQAGHALPSLAMYTPPEGADIPLRKNIHDRHNVQLLNGYSNPDTFRNSFLNSNLPSDYISRIPAPEGAVEEMGLPYPWQTPSRWTYPTAEEGGVDRMSKEPNEGEGGIPDVASEECLKRATVPWTQKKGTKEYLKVFLSFPSMLFYHFKLVFSPDVVQMMTVGRL